MARKKADPAEEAARAALEENKRCYLYSADCPEGKIFKGADAIAAAEKDGWQDTPPSDEPATSGGGKGKK